MDLVTADDGCLVCDQPAAVDVFPMLGGTTWAVPLCDDCWPVGLVLLERMFPLDTESESDCAVVPHGPLDGSWESLGG
jgi:hypothetical protein